MTRKAIHADRAGSQRRAHAERWRSSVWKPSAETGPDAEIAALLCLLARQSDRSIDVDVVSFVEPSTNDLVDLRRGFTSKASNRRAMLAWLARSQFISRKKRPRLFLVNVQSCHLCTTRKTSYAKQAKIDPPIEIDEHLKLGRKPRVEKLLGSVGEVALALS